MTPRAQSKIPSSFQPREAGAVWLFHTAQPGGGRQEECEVILRPLEVAAPQARSGPGRPLGLPLGSFVRARVVVRDDGAWLLPLFLCKGLAGARWTGATTRPPWLSAPTAAQPGRLPTYRIDRMRTHDDCTAGRTAHGCLFRRRQADFVYRTESVDGGRSWSAPEPTDVPNNNSSIAAIRLADGRIALLCNPVSAAQSSERRASLYDELGEDDARADPTGGVEAIWGVPRAPLSLCLSYNEGRSFPVRRIVDDGPGTCLSDHARRP